MSAVLTRLGALATRWAPWGLCGYWTLLLCATHAPHLSGGPHIQNFDKVEHVTAYALLAAMLWFVMRNRTSWPAWRRVVSVLVIIAVSAALDERTQPYFGRECDLFDWIADMTGTVVALTIGELWVARRRRSVRPPSLTTTNA